MDSHAGATGTQWKDGSVGSPLKKDNELRIAALRAEQARAAALEDGSAQQLSRRRAEAAQERAHREKEQALRGALDRQTRESARLVANNEVLAHKNAALQEQNDRLQALVARAMRSIQSTVERGERGAPESPPPPPRSPVRLAKGGQQRAQSARRTMPGSPCSPISATGRSSR